MAIMKHRVTKVMSNEPYYDNIENCWWVDVLAMAEEPDVGDHFVLGSAPFATLEEALAIYVGYEYYMNWGYRGVAE